MRTFVAVGLAAVLCAAGAGCGSEPAPPSNPANAPAGAPKAAAGGEPPVRGAMKPGGKVMRPSGAAPDPQK